MKNRTPSGCFFFTEKAKRKKTKVYGASKKVDL